MKGINVCGDCALYDWKWHECPICKDEGKAQDPFYVDCPLPDVEETKPGKWIYENKPIHCSCCGFEPTYSLNCDNALYCPHCGAKMEDDKK